MNGGEAHGKEPESMNLRPGYMVCIGAYPAYPIRIGFGAILNYTVQVLIIIQVTTLACSARFGAFQLEICGGTH